MVTGRSPSGHQASDSQQWDQVEESEDDEFFVFERYPRRVTFVTFRTRKAGTLTSEDANNWDFWKIRNSQADRFCSRARTEANIKIVFTWNKIFNKFYFEFCNILLFSFFNWSWLWALQLEIILFFGWVSGRWRHNGVTDDSAVFKTGHVVRNAG